MQWLFQELAWWICSDTCPGGGVCCCSWVTGRRTWPRGVSISLLSPGLGSPSWVPGFFHSSWSFGKPGSPFSSVLHAAVPSICHQISVSAEMVYIWSKWVRELFAYLFILYKVWVSWKSGSQCGFFLLFIEVITGTCCHTWKWDVDLFIRYAETILCTHLTVNI